MKKVKSAFKVFIRKVVTKKILKVGVKNITKRISKPFTRQLKMKIHKNKNLKIPSNWIAKKSISQIKGKDLLKKVNKAIENPKIESPLLKENNFIS